MQREASKNPQASLELKAFALTEFQKHISKKSKK